MLLQVEKLTIAQGQSVAIRGASGAGKSTLLHVISGLLPPRAGEVRWGNTDLVALPEAARTSFRRSHIGMIFQDYLLFDELDVLGNAALGAAFAPRSDRAALRDRAQGWLDKLGLGKAGARRTGGLSGGERQRVAVARALCNRPAVILADEPTASLDRDAANRLITDLVDVSQAQGSTLLCVTHDIGLIESLNRTLTMADGQIVEDRHG